MPGLDGMAVLDALRAIDPWATVIMLTGYGSIESATHALRLGAYDFIQKPFTEVQIEQAATRAIAHKKQLKQITQIQGSPGSPSDLPGKLKEMEQLKADFLTMVVQELRIPLKLFSETLGLAQEGFYGPWEDPLKKRFFNELIRVRAQLGRLLLEGFALFLGHEQRVTAAPLDVRQIIEQAAAEFHSSCEERGLALKVNLPEAPLIGLTDLEKVGCIVRELIDNAIQFTPSGGKIELDLRATPEGFEFRVSDTGCGITTRQKEWLFTTFRQPQSDPSERRKKVALGLALVRHYVDLLDGTILVQSAPGQGAQLTISLPWWKS
jgi:signal transduction histidine kinase